MGLRSKLSTFVVLTAFVVTGCPSPDVEEDEPPTEEPTIEEEMVEEEDEEEPHNIGVVDMEAVAEVMTSEEEEMGTVEFTQTEEGVRIEGELEYEELADGLRGFHVHEYGECEAPDFQSAGGHFNPQGHPHGSPDDAPDQRHTGDLGNLEFDEDGVVEIDMVDDVMTLGEGENDVVGHALMIHYNEDDFETQPTGDAGPRAGCGVIEAVDEQEDEMETDQEEIDSDQEEMDSDEEDIDSDQDEMETDS